MHVAMRENLSQLGNCSRVLIEDPGKRHSVSISKKKGDTERLSFAGSPKTVGLHGHGEGRIEEVMVGWELVLRCTTSKKETAPECGHFAVKPQRWGRVPFLVLSEDKEENPEGYPAEANRRCQGQLTLARRLEGKIKSGGPPPQAPKVCLQAGKTHSGKKSRSGTMRPNLRSRTRVTHGRRILENAKREREDEIVQMSEEVVEDSKKKGTDRTIWKPFSALGFSTVMR